MENTESEKVRGVVIYKKTNAGTKSESVAPFLYRGRDAAMLRLLLKDDNPFENSGLDAYDGLSVELTGKMSPSGTFIVEAIAVVALNGK